MHLFQLPSDLYSAREYAAMLGVTPRAVLLKLANVPADSEKSFGTRPVKLWRPTSLPTDYQQRLSVTQQQRGCTTVRELQVATDRSWKPDFQFAQQPPATQIKAQKVRQVMEEYYAVLDQTGSKTSANTAARSAWSLLMGEACNEKTIRRWDQKVEQCGGIEHAPIEAFCDRKAVPHCAARIENKKGIPADFIAAFKAQCVAPGNKHMRGALRKFEIDWLSGRPVPGLGIRQFAAQPFPFKASQLRKFAPAFSARVRGNRGEAAARVHALPYNTNDTSNLKRAQLIVLDDSRIDIIATDPMSGRPVELKSYFLMDVATRRIEGFLVKEAGSIRAADVDGLLARVFRTMGIAPEGAGYTTRILFERGAVACSSARESYLRSLFPGRLEIDRTLMDGGRNFAGDYVQEGSGRWMNKAWIESFMRTLSYFTQHLPGQRGSTYGKQPAQLGLIGRDRKSGRIKFTQDSQVAEGALLARADVALQTLSADPRFATNIPGVDQVNGRMRLNALLPVPWIIDGIKEVIAYYNQRTDHRHQGFRRLEYIAADGSLQHRQESPNERAAWLEGQHGSPERISPAVCSALLLTSKTVTVRRNGVLMEIEPRKLRFWKADSICRQQADLNGGEKQFLALYDAEGLAQGTAAAEIYLCGMPEDPNWKPGDPVRFIEHLPLAVDSDLAAPVGERARTLAELTREQKRLAGMLVDAAAPLIDARIEDARANNALLTTVTSTLGIDRQTASDSPLAQDIARSRREADVADEDDARLSRSQQKEDSAQEFARLLAKNNTQTT